jgi:two-component system response regulator YesN
MKYIKFQSWGKERYMYKILVVDEERLFIDDIIETINEKTDMAKVVDFATSGRDAVEMAKKIKPDIIFLDVKISGINGLEAIKMIKEFLPNVHIVIVSAYDYFGFLREAIRLNVDDYILKPVNKTNLIDVLNGILYKLKIEKEKVQKEGANQILINDVIKHAEQNFMYSVLINKNFLNELGVFQNIINIPKEGFVINIGLDSNTINLSQENQNNYNNIYTCIKKSLNEYECISIIGPRIGNRIVCYISIGEKSTLTKSKSDAIFLIKNVQLALNKELGIDTCIGIGSYCQLDDILISFQETIQGLVMSEGECIVHIADQKESNGIEYKEYIELQLRLVESIKLAKDESVEIFCSMLKEIELLNDQYRKNKIIELLVLSCYASKTYSKNENEFFDYISMLEHIKDTENEELDTWALRQFSIIIKATRTNVNDKVSNVVSMALKYIEEHYNEELSLEEVSRHVSVSPQYLSKLFKEETDSNFVEYTTKLRIQKAKDLMNSTDKTIKEICYMVGYHDPNYFSRKFKSIVGISPTDYLKGKEAVIGAV